MSFYSCKKLKNVLLFVYKIERLIMKDQEKNENILFKKLDLAFVYIFIFLVGIAIVLSMTSYLNNKVKEFSEGAVYTNINK